MTRRGRQSSVLQRFAVLVLDSVVVVCLPMAALLGSMVIAPAAAEATCFGCGSALTVTESATYSTATVGTPVLDVLHCQKGPTGRYVTLDWPAAAAATGYNIYRTGGTTGAKLFQTSALTYQDNIPDSELEPLTYNYYVIATVSTAWISPPSNTAQVGFSVDPVNGAVCGHT